MLQAVVIFSSVAVVAFVARGATGGASSMVFNAIFLALVALGVTGELTIRDGLYWLAIANAGASISMAWTLRSMLRFSPVTALYLLGLVPANIVFTIVLTRLTDMRVLGVALGAAIVISGVYQVATPNIAPASDRSVRRWAFPAGVGSGVVGGLFGMGGPVALLFFGRATTDPSEFRAHLTVTTFFGGLTRIIVLFGQGVYDIERLAVVALTVPAIALGIVVGFRVHRYLRPGPFRMGVGSLIIGAGLLGLFESLRQ